MEYTEAKVKDIFVDFLKTFKDFRNELKYRILTSQLPSRQGISVLVDYSDLLAFNTDIAINLVKEPELYLKAFDEAAIETLSIEDPVYAEKNRKEIHIRIRDLTDPLSLRDVAKSQLNTLIMVRGMVVRSSELRPMAVLAAFRCTNMHITYVEQSGVALKRPIKCETEGCGESKNFELDELKTEFIDFQIIRIQELPEELPPGQLPQTFDVHLIGDIVNSARPGDRIVLTGIVKAESEFSAGAGKLRLFTYRIEGNFVEQLGKSPEETEITREDEENIKALAALPGAYDRLIASVAPAIFGHEIHKEAALLLMVGAKQKPLPDGASLRGDINILLVGDPGCLVADERIVLGNGAIVKIGEIGDKHLQKIDLQVLTGQGLKRDSATTFHKYVDQPIIEIITESGKSLKGTYNHPVLARKREFGSAQSEWRRLDEMKIGDRIFVTTGIHCTVTKPLKTNFRPRARKNNLGPSLKEKLPEAMSIDLAALCGYITGDGWIRKTSEQTSFVVAETDKDILQTLISLSRKLFGLEPHIAEKKLEGRSVLLYYVTIHSKDIATNLLFLNDKRVPDLILRSGNEVAASYLRWLFEADGNVFPLKYGSGCVGLKAKNIELLRDVQILLLRFGIHSRINQNALLIRRAESLLKFTLRIGFASKRKRAALAVLAKLAGAKRMTRVQRLERVVKILKHPREDVYDIEVPNGHRFIANGIISHNTAKSELLKYVSRVAPRALFTSGRGTTAAGLTAAVVREKNGMMMLEAGATVLADLGVAVIDEFDKMRKEDRDALHEVMEQQSYHPSFEISLAEGRRVTIGRFVDELLDKNADRIIKPKDCEILQLVQGAEIYTCDLPTSNITRVRIDRVSRHKPPKKFVSIKYSNGRTILVTPEHPVFVYRSGSITTIPASDVTNRDYVPIPQMIPNSSVPQALLESLEQRNRGKPPTIPRTLTPELARLLGFLLTEGHSYAGMSYEICFSNTDERLLDDVKSLFDHLFSINPSISEKHGVTTLRYTSKGVFDWFAQNFPEIMEHARQKRVPQKVLGSSVKVIRELLASAFLSDGSVESTSICYRTASFGLAEDYQDLLHKLGIMSRISNDNWNDSFKVYVADDSISLFCEKIVEQDDKRFDRLKESQSRSAGTPGGQDTFPPETARQIASMMLKLGIPYSNYFHEHLKGHFGVNRSTVETCLAKIDEAIARFEQFALNPFPLKPARTKLRISQQMLANISGVKRGAIDYLERGGHGKKSEKMIQQLGLSIEEYSRALRLESQRMRNLLHYRFIRVSEIKLVQNSGRFRTDWVYDVTVEPTHNFISKGLILHNTASVAKGGFIATLNARTSILAAANPVFGKYDPYKNILDNVNLPVPLLTRFDLVFIVKDEPDSARDRVLAKHILDLHANLSFPKTPPIDFDTLKKYIIYAKKLDPELTEEARNRLSDYYIELRRLAQPGQIAVTPRWLEGLIRLSIARARLLLHTRVSEDDALRAVTLMRRMLETVAVDQNSDTKQVDVGVLYGKPLSERNLLETALETFKKLEGSGASKQAVEDKVFIEELQKTGKFKADEADKMLKTLYRSGQIYETKPHFYRKI